MRYELINESIYTIPIDDYWVTKWRQPSNRKISELIFEQTLST